ncbi:cytochrome c-type biogenesis protein CcsB [Kineosphaera limosa]|uniref:Putative cytochrome c assembly protein n=1 Tax=Kineosphaera limosa NBRC 100340 TaxID=1184609 RepID=K6XCD1_9MICO|nr:c-type cytochrome biogenesis protein CcsB [Kineosphaera limosa]NYE01738.1 cytochrome c-type biogenesis protein CcsB [Kineosphaera limosa]GAB96464.1 putative cytochrome c assembly protein [Kineosphaera limosa NBRC 100340]
MDGQSLATLSNLVLYGAMGVYAFTMIAFAVHLAFAAGRASRRAGGEQAAVAEQRVAAGVGGRGDAGEVGSPTARSAQRSSDAAERASLGARAGGWAMSLGWLGTLLLGASIALRGASVQRAPVSNMFEFACAAAFLVMLIYLVLAMRRPLRWLGLFVVTPVLLALGLAITVWYTEASELVPSLKSTWLVIHVPVAILSTAIFTISFCVLLLHLAQARREARKAAGLPVRFDNFLAALPTAASLDRTAYGLVVVAFPLWTFTLIAGAIWGQQAWGTYWSWDPKEVWTFVIWVIYAAYLHARATSNWSLRTANIIAVVGYLAIIVNFTIVNMYFPGMHSYSGLVTP